ncbi:acyl-CoA dehydrogenase family protein [Actinomadura sp. 7K534]|uniref:acyl-CoA dehydrogenase family protein n=1 Tax=Actinomadura sp. 7K534 TaxID=2530366 RepID=UPI00104ECEB2|nr:acyl-CoA dehydrogenase family protein [Actinomadura sp. 7K534]TDB95465.1 acyl-CoA dehydrogenase [Actinomadura sp. 7K534]
MDFTLSPEQAALRDSARDYLAAKVPLGLAREADETETFPHEVYRGLGDLGWQGLPFSEEYGGSGGDEFDEALVVEQLGYAMMPLAACFLVTVLTCGKTIRDVGTEAQRRAWLPGISAGTAYVSYALTEPSAGSDAASIRTTASKTGDGWRINGQKMFCTGADMASVILLIARTGGPGKDGLSMFLVDPKTPGITIQRLPKLGLRPYHTCVVFFDDVDLPADALLGTENEAWRYIVASLNRERIACAAMTLGTGQAALDYAVAYAKEREQFGVPIGSFQAIRHRLADAHVRLRQARLLTHRAAWLEANGLSSTRAASMAKVWATETCVDVAGDGMRVLGGYSYTMDHPMQRYLRDALIHPIGAGTNEIQRNIIAKELIG